RIDELRGDRSADQSGKLLATARDILLRLLPPVLILAPLSLNRDYVLAAMTIKPNIQLINLYLADILYRRAQVILKRGRGNPQENIHQPVVPHLCKQRLFVAERMRLNNLRCRIGNLYDKLIGPGLNGERALQAELVLGSANAVDCPLQAIRRCLQD